MKAKIGERNLSADIFALVSYVWIFFFPASLFCQSSAIEKLQSTQDSIQKYLYANPDRAIEFAQEYKQLAFEQDSLFLKGKALNFLGMVQYVRGDPDDAIANYMEALPIFESLDNQWFIAMMNNNIGAVYQVRKQPMETLEYYKKALSGFEELKDSLWMANLYNNISIQKNELGLYDEELKYKDKAIQIYKLKGDEEMLIFTIGNMAHTYFKLKDYKQSIYCADQYLNSPETQQDFGLKTKVMLAKSYSLHAIGDSDHSLMIAKEALKICDSLSLLETKIKLHLHLSDIYKSRNNYQAAFESYTLFHELSDSLFNATKDSTMQDLLMKYDTEKKESAIAALEARNAEQSMLIRQDYFMKLGLIAGLLGIALIAFFAWRARNVKNLANIQLQEKNEIISKTLLEKNILLKEIHHRVKNNLQVISSLLKLQGQYIEDEQAMLAIAEGRNRVNSMALLHQNLYRDDNITGVNMEEYFTSLIEGLFDAYNVHPDKVKLETHIDPLTLDIDTVIPLGLITNELVSNSLKHAFENVNEALLQVILWEEDDYLMLRVRDNGVGIDFQNAEKSAGSFGQKLIKSLSEKLEAEVSTVISNGTEITLKVKDYKKVA